MNMDSQSLPQKSPKNSATEERRLIEDSVRFINEKAQETLYKGALEIGNYILKHFFNDDIELASSKNPKKPKSYSALCAHGDLSVPYSTLTVMVRVAAQERFLREHRIDIDRLGYTQKATLIRLHNNKQKLTLARKCVDEQLSTRQLNEIVQKTQKKMLSGRKEDQEETAFKNIMKIEQLIGRSEKAELVTDINKIRSMQTKTREDLRQKARELLQVMAQTSKDCRKLIKNLEKVEKEKSV
ncbi:MAG: hypothetical protein ACOZF0_02745 [Thermodesulfobacteriota bacterium]